MNTHRDIVIVGGGLAGPTLAICLAQAGLSVTVIDREAETVRRNAGFDGRSYALSLGTVRLLRAIDLWPEVSENAQPILEIKVSQGRAGEGPDLFGLHFDHAEIEEGPMGHMLEDRYLRRSLLDTIAATPTIEHISGVSVVDQSVEAGRIRVSLDDGSHLTSHLLIGADGRTSGTAERAGIKRMAWGYGQTALVCAIGHEKPHDGIAHQYFMPPGPLAILPLPGNRSSIVWSETKAEAMRLSDVSPQTYLEHLRPRFGSFLGEIHLEGKRYSYPLGLSLAQTMVADRLALIGDAAHGLHPIAGQGLNAGMRDIAALRDVVVDALKRGEDIGSAPVLERYARWRRFDVTTLALATDGFNRLFSNDGAVLRMARGLGMGLVQSLPALRRGFMREAAGLTGDLPTLMRG